MPELTLDEIIASLPSREHMGNKFAPKLGFAERAEIMCLLHLNFPTKFIAHVFGVNPNTILSVRNTARPMYRDIKQEYQADPDSFIRRHMKPQRLKELAERREAWALIECKIKAIPTANAFAKVPYRSLYLGEPYEFEVIWKERDALKDLDAGWYVRDGKEEDVGPYQTSKAAFMGTVSEMNLKRVESDFGLMKIPS